MNGHVEQNWEATLEELVACSAILQDSFRCWAGGREVPEFTSDEADSLREQGPSGNHLSCSAVVHLPLPDAGLTLQVLGPTLVVCHSSASPWRCCQVRRVSSACTNSGWGATG